MNYKSYATKKVTPQRMSRKRMRRDVFMANKKMTKVRRKVARAERKSSVVEI